MTMGNWGCGETPLQEPGPPGEKCQRVSPALRLLSSSQAGGPVDWKIKGPRGAGADVRAALKHSRSAANFPFPRVPPGAVRLLCALRAGMRCACKCPGAASHQPAQLRLVTDTYSEET